MPEDKLRNPSLKTEPYPAEYPIFLEVETSTSPAFVPKVVMVSEAWGNGWVVEVLTIDVFRNRPDQLFMTKKHDVMYLQHRLQASIRLSGVWAAEPILEALDQDKDLASMTWLQFYGKDVVPHG